MEDTQIKFIEASDLQFCIVMDSSYHTEYVWQMEVFSEDHLIDISFREIKLPRSMRVEYPRTNEQIIDAFQKRDAVMVAMVQGEPAGYLSLSMNKGNSFVQVTDLVVNRRFRRRGIGKKLIRFAQNWALDHDFRLMRLEMQSKNYPAIEMASSLGFEFCGFSDRYYKNNDIALFFLKRF